MHSGTTRCLVNVDWPGSRFVFFPILWSADTRMQGPALVSKPGRPLSGVGYGAEGSSDYHCIFDEGKDAKPFYQVLRPEKLEARVGAHHVAGGGWFRADEVRCLCLVTSTHTCRVGAPLNPTLLQWLTYMPSQYRQGEDDHKWDMFFDRWPGAVVDSCEMGGVVHVGAYGYSMSPSADMAHPEEVLSSWHARGTTADDDKRAPDSFSRFSEAAVAQPQPLKCTAIVRPLADYLPVASARTVRAAWSAQHRNH